LSVIGNFILFMRVTGWHGQTLFVRASFNAYGGLPPLAITFLPSGHYIKFFNFQAWKAVRI